MSERQFTPDEAKSILRKAIEVNEGRNEKTVTSDEIRGIANEVGVAGEIVDELLSRPERVLVNPRPVLAQPAKVRCRLQKTQDSLVLTTRRAGWTEISSFPLIMGGGFAIIGLLGLFVALTQGDRSWIGIGLVSISLGTWIGRGGVRSALESHVIELTIEHVRVEKWIGRRSEVFDADIRFAMAQVKTGRAWEMGVPILWYDLHREFSVLSLDCGTKRFRILDGAREEEKRWVASELNAWIEAAKEVNQSMGDPRKR